MDYPGMVASEGYSRFKDCAPKLPARDPGADGEWLWLERRWRVARSQHAGEAPCDSEGWTYARSFQDLHKFDAATKRQSTVRLSIAAHDATVSHGPEGDSAVSSRERTFDWVRRRRHLRTRGWFLYVQPHTRASHPAITPNNPHFPWICVHSFSSAGMPMRWATRAPGMRQVAMLLESENRQRSESLVVAQSCGRIPKL